MSCRGIYFLRHSNKAITISGEVELQSPRTVPGAVRVSGGRGSHTSILDQVTLTCLRQNELLVSNPDVVPRRAVVASKVSVGHRSHLEAEHIIFTFV